MILRRLHVEQFRRHNLAVDIDFNERLTIVAGLNEAGKTTLFEALQYAFFRRSGATGKDIEALAPWDTAGLSPAVAVDFEHAGSEYRLQKTWGKRGSTQLAKRSSSGIFLPDMGENADEFLASVFGGQPAKQGLFSGFTGQHMGLAYLLFVPQGSVPIAGETKVIGLHTDARARMTEIIGAASQSPKAASIAKTISATYGKHFTLRGERRGTTGAAKFVEQIAELERRIAVTREKVESFERVAEELEAEEAAAAAAALEAAEAKEAAQLSRPRYEAAVKLEAALVKAEDEFRLASQQYDVLAEESELRESTLRKVERLRPVRDRLAAAVATAEAALSAAEGASSAAIKALEDASAPDAGLASLEAQLAAAQAAALARQQMAALAGQVERADAIDRRVSEIDAACASALPVTQSAIEDLRRLAEAERELQTRLGAAETSLGLVAERELTVVWQSAGSAEGRKVLGAGERFELSADSRLALRIEGVARFDVRGPVSDAGELRTQLSVCREQRSELEKALGSNDPLELQQRLATRQGLDAERARLLAERGDLLGDVVLEDLRTTLSEKRSLLASAPDEQRAEALRALVEGRKAARASSIAALTEKRRAASTQVEELRGQLATALDEQELVEVERRGLEAVLARLQRAGEGEDDWKRARSDAFKKRCEAESRCLEARKAYEPYGGDVEPLEELSRLQDEAEASMRAELEAKARVRALQAKLAEGFTEAPGLELTRLEEELERLRAQLADEVLTEEAMRLLQSFVVASDARRVATFAQPVLDRVGPWFRQVTGNELLRLDLSSDNEVTGLHLGGVERAVRFDELSQGMCDQLALLIRLAFASLLSSSQFLGAMPVLLDDPLVHADWQRRPRFRDILEEVSSTAQVIVFTCRPEDYEGLPGALVTVGPSKPQEAVAPGVA